MSSHYANATNVVLACLTCHHFETCNYGQQVARQPELLVAIFEDSAPAATQATPISLIVAEGDVPLAEDH